MATIEHTRKRFKKRIEFEREIITILNSINNSTPLHGLSKLAIVNWIDSNDFSEKAILNNEVDNLSKSLMIFCDNSKNTFDLDKRISEIEMRNKILNLKRLVDKL